MTIVDITSKRIDITPAIRRHVEHCLSKLDKWHTQLINPHVVLSKGPEGFVADASISTPNGILVASARHHDMYTAINELLPKLERQLNKFQHKNESRRATTGMKEIPLTEMDDVAAFHDVLPVEPGK